MQATSFHVIKCVSVLVLGFLASPASGAESVALKTEQEKQSYALGVDLAKGLQRQGVQVDVKALVQGIEDQLSGNKLMMTEDEARDTMRAYQTEVRRARLQTRGGTGAVIVKNREEGAAFLAENKTKEGVVALPSGLQYKILNTGNGKKPTDSDKVECRFRGTFINGEEFSNSERGGQPANLNVKGEATIAGVSEALKLMPVGSQWRLFIPAELAYGEKGVVDGRGRVKIEPNKTLIFDLELLAIK